MTPYKQEKENQFFKEDVIRNENEEDVIRNEKVVSKKQEDLRLYSSIEKTVLIDKTLLQVQDIEKKNKFEDEDIETSSEDIETSSFDSNQRFLPSAIGESKSSPMSFPMVSCPEVFETPILNNADADKDFKPATFFYHDNGFYRSAKHYTKGGYLCNNSKYNNIFENSKNKNYTQLTTAQTTLLPHNGVQDPLSNILKTELWKTTDLNIKQNSFVENTLQPLINKYYIINNPFLKYILENLHCIIECGLMPPLNNIADSDIARWIYFQRDLFISENRKQIFTGQSINITVNGLPQGLGKKLKESLFTNKLKAYSSIKGIREKILRSIKTAFSFINSPIFIPIQLDWRGRIYYRTEFNPLQDSFTRTLLNFSKPSLVIKDTDAEFFFFVALGKSIKKQKSFQDSFNFVVKHKKNILESLENFNWVTFDEPYVALNLILNFKIYVESSQQQKKKGILLYIQIPMDASASMFQITSALTKNSSSATMCNLIPVKGGKGGSGDLRSAEILDIYTKILKIYQETVFSPTKGLVFNICQYIKTNYKTKNRIDANWTEKDVVLQNSGTLSSFLFSLSRKILKRIIMTMFYGKGKKGIAQDFIESLVLLE